MENKYPIILEKIREYGISFRLDDKEIDRCLISAFTKWNSHSPVASKKVVYQKPKISKINFKKLLILLIAVVCVILPLVAVNIEVVRSFIIRFVGNHVLYPAMRSLRFAALPVIKNIDLSRLHDDYCLVANPFFEEETLDCDVYAEISKIDSVENVNRLQFHEKYIEGMKSLHLVGSHATLTSTDLKKFYLENSNILESGLNFITSNDGRITNLHTLMNNIAEFEGSQNLHVEWLARRFQSFRTLLKIFPRPIFMTKSYEISLERTVLFDSYNTASYDVPAGGSPHQWYVQLSGSRIIQFTPPLRCQDIIAQQNVTLTAGDIIYYYRPLWEMKSLPVENIKTQSRELGMSYVGSFNSYKQT